MASVTPNQISIQDALVNFLKGVLPSGVVVVAGQVNRVGEPSAGDFVVFWPIARNRLSWNIDAYEDGVFTGSITGDQLNITAVNPAFKGALAVGLLIFGVGIAANTQITALGTGSGGIGSYTVSISQTILSETIAAGTAALIQKTEVVMQCDVHGPNSSDNAQVIATVMRDGIAERYFQPDTTGVAPLFAEDPKQVPFLNGEDQYETRWIVEVHLQVDQSVIFPQEFADVVDVDVISVDATYPP